MPLQATSGAASYDAFGGGAAAVTNYIEDVFSTYLYTGNGSTQTITNGIDLSTKGGLLWIKNRASATFPGNYVFDSARGAGSGLITNTTDAADGSYSTGFTTSGFTLAGDNATDQNTITYASWTFRKQPKFFDIVTYTGVGGNNRSVPHNLGSVPGCVIVKRTDSTGSWFVWHRSIGTAGGLLLNATDAVQSYYWDSADQPTSTNILVSNSYGTNANGATYVAYLFAHNAGGFGLTGTDNVISCGSYTGVGGGNVATITLGYEPQWILVKRADSSLGGNWAIFDNMRGMSVNTTNNASMLNPNLSDSESVLSSFKPTATGFQTGDNFTATGGTYIYIAIRRGPMAVPTVGTSVFKAITRTGTGATVTVSGAGFAPDLVATANRDTNGFGYYDKLRGALNALRPSQTAAEATYTTTLTGFTNDGYTAGSNSDGFGEINGNTDPYVNHLFRRAPSFFDEVCYTGTGVARTVTHNLVAVPELMIVKRRNDVRDWNVYASPLGATKFMYLNTQDSVQTDTMWNDTAPTSSVFTVGTYQGVNASASTYVAYLFATCAGVSKVGSYTGTATTLQIDCGFTGGARFVLIKRTDSTGGWFVWDSARGIVSGNDPYLLLNSTAAEVTNTDYIDTYSAGFEISSTAPAAINASAGSFIFLAIA